MITVLLPTHNRPELLKGALQSVLNQDLDLITKVVISDNSDNDDSRSIVEGFKSPLLVYEKIDPPHIDWVRRQRELFDHVQSSYYAILHDDDWWHPDHLRANYRALERNPDCNFCSSSFLALSESRTLIRREFPLSELILVLSGQHISIPEIKITKAVGYTYCLMGGFSHFSTMVGRASLLDSFSEIYDDKLFTYDTDRLMLFMAVKHGTPIHLPSPSVTVVETENHASLKYQNIGIPSMRNTGKFIYSQINPELLGEIASLLDGVAAKCASGKSRRVAQTIRDYAEICPLDEQLTKLMPNYRELIRKRSLVEKVIKRLVKLSKSSG